MSELIYLWIVRLVTATIVFFAGYLLQRAVLGFYRRTATKLHWEEIVTGYISTLMSCVLWFLVISWTLAALKVDLGPLLATVGIGGFMIGLGARQSIANYFAGLMLLGARAFKKGNLVDIGGQLGRVEEVRLSFTALRTLDNVRVVLPNSVAWRGKILNYSAHHDRAIRFTISIPDGVDVDWVRDICLHVLGRHENVENDPPPQFTVSDVGAKGVVATITAWSTPEDMNVFGSVIVEMRKDLEDADLEVVVPAKDIDLRKEE